MPYISPHHSSATTSRPVRRMLPASARRPAAGAAPAAVNSASGRSAVMSRSVPSIGSHHRNNRPDRSVTNPSQPAHAPGTAGDQAVTGLCGPAGRTFSFPGAACLR